MADSACSRLGVPERLHRERREPNRTFDEDEELYHRFPGHLDDENLKEAISFEPGNPTTAANIVSLLLTCW